MPVLTKPLTDDTTAILHAATVSYVEERAEVAQQQFFPTALLSSDVDRAVAKVLRARGFTPANTLFGHSVCADEVNNRKEQLVPLLVNRWEEGEKRVLSASRLWAAVLRGAQRPRLSSRRTQVSRSAASGVCPPRGSPDLG